MKHYGKHFADWMYPYGDEETPATKVDDQVRDFHNYIERMMEEAYKAGYKQGYSDGVDRVLNGE